MMRYLPSRWLGLVGLLTAAVVLSACGKSSSSTAAAGDASRAVSIASPPSGCGSFSAPTVADPNGVLAALPSAQRQLYAGYPFTVRKSAWVGWKPKHGPPYTVGVQWGAITTD